MSDYPQNDPNYRPQYTSDFCAEVDHVVRENPTRAVLVAVGAGIALGLIVRALQPRPVESRAARLLHEIQDRLHDLADPAYRKVSALAGDGADYLKEGVNRLHDLHLDRRARSLGQRVRDLFN